MDQVLLPKNCSIFFNFAALSSEFQHVWLRPMTSMLGMAHSVETYVSREVARFQAIRFIEVPNADFQILHVARARVNGTGSAHAPH